MQIYANYDKNRINQSFIIKGKSYITVKTLKEYVICISLRRYTSKEKN